MQFDFTQALRNMGAAQAGNEFYSLVKNDDNSINNSTKFLQHQGNADPNNPDGGEYSAPIDYTGHAADLGRGLIKNYIATGDINAKSVIGGLMAKNASTAVNNYVAPKIGLATDSGVLAQAGGDFLSGVASGIIQNAANGNKIDIGNIAKGAGVHAGTTAATRFALEAAGLNAVKAGPWAWAGAWAGSFINPATTSGEAWGQTVGAAAGGMAAASLAGAKLGSVAGPIGALFGAVFGAAIGGIFSSAHGNRSATLLSNNDNIHGGMKAESTFGTFGIGNDNHGFNKGVMDKYLQGVGKIIVAADDHFAKELQFTPEQIEAAKSNLAKNTNRYEFGFEDGAIKHPTQMLLDRYGSVLDVVDPRIGDFMREYEKPGLDEREAMARDNEFDFAGEHVNTALALAKAYQAGEVTPEQLDALQTEVAKRKFAEMAVDKSGQMLQVNTPTKDAFGQGEDWSPGTRNSYTPLDTEGMSEPSAASFNRLLDAYKATPEYQQKLADAPALARQRQRDDGPPTDDGQGGFYDQRDDRNIYQQDRGGN